LPQSRAAKGFAKGRFVRLGWRWVFIGVCGWSCAGDLRDPERFSFVINSEAGSGGGSGGAGGIRQASGDRTAPTCVTALFKARCAMPSCHASGSMYVDLMSGKVEDRLIDKNSSVNGLCSGRMLVSTQSGMQSLLLQKLGDIVPCGSKMPLGGMATAAEVKSVSDWVGSLSEGGGD
jgi:hypothetical protein